LAAQEYADRTGLATAPIRARFEAEIGYITAKVGVDGAMFDADDRILLVRRVDDGCWGLIAGFVEPSEAPEQTIVREFQEEVGLIARVDQLVGVWSRQAAIEEQPHGIVSIVYLCQPIGGELRAQPHEVREIAWRAIDDVEDWHFHHEMLARAALEARWRHAAGG
jgi:ADP-ribose pyrophosphatase YjhB (NUDIX family)